MILSNIFSFESVISPSGLSGGAFAVCILAAIVLGFSLGLFFLYRNSTSQSVVLTIALMPTVVSVIIMLVGNNLGAGIAVAGSFSLVRFRSQPATAREIISLLTSCALGYACGSGYILVGILLTAIVVLVQFLFLVINIGGRSFVLRKLKITIPESLDYVGVFDDVAKALQFDDEKIRNVIENIAEIKAMLPGLVKDCLAFFPGVDRKVGGLEGLREAQSRLDTDAKKASFAETFGVLHRAWEILSPDPVLETYKDDYTWLSQVYESVRKMAISGGLLWKTLGAKTIKLIHENITSVDIGATLEELVINSAVLDAVITEADAKRKSEEVVKMLHARLGKHAGNPKFKKIADKVEELKEKMRQNLMTSIEFLKQLLVMAKELLDAEKELAPEDKRSKAKAALTELFLANFSVAPEAMETVPVPRAPAASLLPICRVPPEIVVVPMYVLSPAMVSSPAPALFRFMPWYVVLSLMVETVKSLSAAVLMVKQSLSPSRTMAMGAVTRLPVPVTVQTGSIENPTRTYSRLASLTCSSRAPLLSVTSPK